MITQIGKAIFQNNLLNDGSTLTAVFPLTECDISFDFIKDVQTGVKHTIIDMTIGYSISIVAYLKLFYVEKTNPITGTKDNVQFETLASILAKYDGFYFMPNKEKEGGVFKIIEEDFNNNLAYFVKIEDTKIDDFIKHIFISGQIFDLTMKTPNIIKITDIIPEEGYGRGGYGNNDYGD